jgi:hypothetical protein
LVSPHLYNLADTETSIFIDPETEQIFNITQLDQDIPTARLDERLMEKQYNENTLFKNVVDFINNPVGMLKGIAVALLSIPSLKHEPLIIKRIVSAKKLFARVQRISLLLGTFIELGGTSDNISVLKETGVLTDMRRSINEYRALKRSIEKQITLTNAEHKEIQDTVKQAAPEISGIVPREREEIYDLAIKEQISNKLVTLLCELDYLFNQLSKLEKRINNATSSGNNQILTRLNSFAKEMVDAEFNNKLEDKITQENAEMDLVRAREMTQSEILSNVTNIERLMLGLSQYDDMFGTCKDARSRSRSRSSSRSSSRSRMPLAQRRVRSLLETRNKDISKSRSRSRETHGKERSRSRSRETHGKVRSRSRSRSPSKSRSREKTSKERSPSQSRGGKKQNRTVKNNKKE